MSRRNRNREELEEQEPPQDQDPRRFGIRKLSMVLFGLVLVTLLGCGTAVSIHFNDPKWFEYAGGSVCTALILVAFFGWPIDD